MLQIESMKLPLTEGEERLPARAAKLLGVPIGEIVSCEVVRRSIDARDGVKFVYTVRVQVKHEDRVLKRCRSKQVSKIRLEPYVLPKPVPTPQCPPVVVGAGPAGLFCALALARCGAKPILLERGKPVEKRSEDVERFWSGGELDPQSNVQYGEGGAGAFSDGKLNTGTRDPSHRFILETLVSFGAPESILTDAKPHVGTDRFHTVLQNMRRELLDLGCDIRFEHRLVGLKKENGRVTALSVESPEGTYTIRTDHAVLALGNSSRDTFAMLYGEGMPMEPKPMAVGVRIEQKQSAIDATQYKELAGHPRLPASTYKLSCHAENGRGVFSFCVCPGGVVVAAASEKQRTVTNGMSDYARDGENINGGLLVSVTPEDYGGDGDPLAGVAFQRKLEEQAYQAGGNSFRAPAQRVEDFLAHRPSVGAGSVKPSYRPGVTWCDLWQVLPEYICCAIEEALPIFDRKLPGYGAPDAVLTAVETRSSCPIRLLRGENGESALFGLWPCGEGAGYAGGIMSAAADGLKTAVHILDMLR